MSIFDSAYNAAEHESRIYEFWLQSGYFNPDNAPGNPTETFTMVLPPPNVTGILHIGHALMVSIEDVLTRYHRMLGKRTLWLPGTDHAAIATQTKVEKLLAKEGKRKTDFSREQFLEQVNTFALQSQQTILQQIKELGASLDWTRLAYTLDESQQLAIRTAFTNMYNDGLIYQADRVINWDPKGQTVISDDEIIHQERTATLYTFKYGKEIPISISTTRPETKVGDTAIAVHPADTRYQEYIGKTFTTEFCGVTINVQIIADESVDPNFGTGALGVTPAHSQTDWELKEKHNLPYTVVINEFGKMNEAAGQLLAGQKTEAARETVVAWLKDQDLLEKEEHTIQNVSTAERSGAVIEPLPKLQWFIGVNKPFTIKHSEIDGIASGSQVTLKQLMRQVVANQQIEIVPKHFEKTYFNWIDNLRDWCISRQLWFGHQIPAWFKGSELYVGIQQPEGEGWQQDADTLDTWFSSGLWTFSTLGWPQQTDDLKLFHPTTVLETGHDIIFFWVARMILMSTYNIGQIPFQKVFFHGLVRDSKGRKISKSLGNAIDPLEMTAKYGTDALRFALLFSTAPGTDTALAEDKIKGMKHFANKLWNMSRYVAMNSTRNATSKKIDLIHHQPVAITPADTQLLEKLEVLIQQCNKNLNSFDLHLASQNLYDFIWKEFADVYIEASKAQLQNPETTAQTQEILNYTLRTVLKLLHPFMPFITEIIWQELYSSEPLMIQTYPQ